MKAHFLVVLDSHADSNGTKKALDELGLVSGEDYLVIGASLPDTRQIFDVKEGERLVDATNLLVFTGRFSPGGSIGWAIAFAETVMRYNSAARVYLRSTVECKPEDLNPVFVGQVRKEFFGHPMFKDIIKRELGL